MPADHGHPSPAALQRLDLHQRADHLRRREELGLDDLAAAAAAHPADLPEVQPIDRGRRRAAGEQRAGEGHELRGRGHVLHPHLVDADGQEVARELQRAGEVQRVEHGEHAVDEDRLADELQREGRPGVFERHGEGGGVLRHQRVRVAVHREVAGEHVEALDDGPRLRADLRGLTAHVRPRWDRSARSVSRTGGASRSSAGAPRQDLRGEAGVFLRDVQGLHAGVDGGAAVTHQRGDVGGAAAALHRDAAERAEGEAHPAISASRERGRRARRGPRRP